MNCQQPCGSCDHVERTDRRTSRNRAAEKWVRLVQPLRRWRSVTSSLNSEPDINTLPDWARPPTPGVLSAMDSGERSQSVLNRLGVGRGLLSQELHKRGSWME